MQEDLETPSTSESVTPITYLARRQQTSLQHAASLAQTRELARQFLVQETSWGNLSMRKFADMHEISPTTLQRHITSLRNDMMPNSAEARALKEDQQRHYRHALEQMEVEKKTASHQKRLATRERKAEESTHYRQGDKSVGGTWPVFRAAVGYAVMLRRNQAPYSEAIEKTKLMYPDITGIDRFVIAKAHKNPDGYPRRVGRQPFMEDKDELILVETVELLRSMKYDMTRHDVIHLANSMLEGTEVAKKFKDGVVGDQWFYRWKADYAHRIKTVHSRPLEFDRARWTTSENIATHYRVVRDLLLDLNLAQKNPSFDDQVQFDIEDIRCQEILITHPGNIASGDETEVCADQCGKHKHTVRGAIAAPAVGDIGEHLGNKSDARASGLGGSLASGISLRPLIVFKGNPTAQQTLHMPPSNKVASNGKLHTAIFDWNDKGSVKANGFRTWLEANFVHEDRVNPHEACIVKATAEKPVLLIVDGVQSHLDLDVLRFCKENHIFLVLRPPHTTHVLQGEDVVNFAKFKGAQRKAVREELRTRLFSHETLAARTQALASVVGQSGLPKASLGPADLMRVSNQAWQHAFCVDANISAWKKTGYSPFSRVVMHELRSKEKKEAMVREVSQQTVGLNPNNIMLPPGASSIWAQSGRNRSGRSSHHPEADGDDSDHDTPLRKRYRSTDFWHEAGGLTHDKQMAKLIAQQEHLDAAASKKAQAQQDKMQKANTRRLEAIQSISSVQNKIAQAGGWYINGDNNIPPNGKLTKQDLLVVLHALGVSYKSTAPLTELRDIARNALHTSGPVNAMS
jgi:hypothetical protein